MGIGSVGVIGKLGLAKIIVGASSIMVGRNIISIGWS